MGYELWLLDELNYHAAISELTTSYRHGATIHGTPLAYGVMDVSDVSDDD